MEALAVIQAKAGPALHSRDQQWRLEITEDGFIYRDQAGQLRLPRPSLPGRHQYDNAGIAITALRISNLPIPPTAFATGIARAEWPARLQQLHGCLAQMLPAGWELWLDGGHNPGAGAILATHITDWNDRPTHIVLGMKQSKDPGGFLRPLLPIASAIWAVVEPGQHLAMPVEAIIAASGGMARPGPTVKRALAQLAGSGGPPARVLICGSLYLAGEVLKQDDAGP
jgi:dihydrofolate synthase/folylpolyglutamate synthase